MELDDIEKDRFYFIKMIKQGLEIKTILGSRRNMDLPRKNLHAIARKIESFMRRYNFIQTWDLTKEDWIMAYLFSRETNLDASDSIQLATAFVVNAHLIVTNDTTLAKEWNNLILKTGLGTVMKVSKPEKALETLAGMGLKV